MRKPFIGFVCDFNASGEVYKGVALSMKLCFANGVNAVCFTEESVDKEKKVVCAMVWTPKGFIEETTELPTFMVCGVCNADFRKFIAENCKIVDNCVLTKQNTNEALLNSEFAETVIPSIYTKNPDRIFMMAKMWKKLILKPLEGARGEGIYCLETIGDGRFRLTDSDCHSYELDKETCINRMSAIFEGFFNVIVQPKVNITNKDGNVMDFRINVSKGGKGSWETIFIIPRSSRGSIVSNLCHGGYTSELDATLEMEYGENADKVYKMLCNLAEKLPPLLEKAMGCSLLSLGIDVGFDRDSLMPYVIEVNQYPTVTYYSLQYYYTQSEYYKYLSEKYDK